jgi:hypothetical protein
MPTITGVRSIAEVKQTLRVPDKRVRATRAVLSDERAVSADQNVF